MGESLDSHFFVVQDEFGGISHIDATQFDNSSVEKWMADETSNACMLCNIDFHPVFRRRHHCRFCGLLFCGMCTDNRTMVNDSVVRVCDACGAILMPPSPNSKYVGLRKWCEDHNCTDTFTNGQRCAGIRYLCSTLESSLSVSHFNAARTLYKLFRSHAPIMIEHGVPKTLIHHSLNCDCENTPITLSLFVNLFHADSEGCDIDFAKEFPDLDCLKLLKESNTEMKRAVSRLLYVLCLKKVIPIPDGLGEAICENDDKWTLAFLIATEALRYPITDFAMIQTAPCEEFIGGSEQLVKKLIAQFDKQIGTVASRYFSAMVLERMAHTPALVEHMLNCDTQNLMNYVSSYAPCSDTDNRPGTQIAICLSSVMLSLWRALKDDKDNTHHVILFSHVLMPLFEIIALPCADKPSNLLVMKAMFLEMFRHIVIHDDLKTSVSSEQIVSLLKDMAGGSGVIAGEAKAALELLS